MKYLLPVGETNSPRLFLDVIHHALSFLRPYLLPRACFLFTNYPAFLSKKQTCQLTSSTPVYLEGKLNSYPPYHPNNHLPVCLSAQLPGYLATTLLPAYLLTYLPACLPAYLPTYHLLTYLLQKKENLEQDSDSIISYSNRQILID